MTEKEQSDPYLHVSWRGRIVITAKQASPWVPRHWIDFQAPDGHDMFMTKPPNLWRRFWLWALLGCRWEKGCTD